jgi:DNA-binding transcriptional regulator YhcF (GntR family)
MTKVGKNYSSTMLFCTDRTNRKPDWYILPEMLVLYNKQINQNSRLMPSCHKPDSIFEIDSEKKTPKYLQIVRSITNSIKSGKLKKGDRVISINELSNEFLLSRDTVQKAYEILEKRGILAPIWGKGFYINRTDVNTSYRILLLFNRISYQKKQIYDSFVKTMGDKASVDLKIYHCDITVFENLLNEHLYNYDWYVIMPHFYEDSKQALAIMQKIPVDKIVILDKDLPYPLDGKYAAVFQDFQRDIYEALQTGLQLLKKYNKLILVFPTITRYPYEIVSGFRNFCLQQDFAYKIINEISPGTEIHPKEAYIVIEENDLVNLVKNALSKKLRIGRNLGVISFNETPLKEILLNGISVISTDHARMGVEAAKMILENRKEKIRNPFVLIKRKSL